MTLVNLPWYSAYNWNGQDTEIRDQNVHPVETDVEMNLPWPQAVARLANDPEYVASFDLVFEGSPISRSTVTKALEQFQMTLLSYNSPFDKYMREEGLVSASVLRGFEIFRTERGDCFHCHSETNSPELFITTRLVFSNNGMDTVETVDGFDDNGFGEVSGLSSDNGKFKVPTLRNLAYTAPFMHDGRFETLADVIEMYNRGPALSPTLDATMRGDAEKRLDTFGHWGLNLSEDEKTDLINFLLSLSDETFINNPEFQAP
jgi:cytochrome c peroxidase